MTDLPKIRYLTPRYSKETTKEIRGQAPYNLITRGRPVDMHWIMNHMNLPEDSEVLEFGAWPADNWRVARSRWKNLLVTDSFGWLNGRSLPRALPQDAWEEALDKEGVAHAQLDVQDMDYHELFKGIYSVSVLEHVIRDDIGLENIFNALVPGGLFVFTAEMNPYIMLKYDEQIYFRVYQQGVLMTRLEAAGFEVNPDAHDFSDFEEQFRAAVKDKNLLRYPYKHFTSAGVVARKPE